MPRLEKKVTVKCKQGLHARPAALFVQKADKYDSEVFLVKDGETVNAKSIMGILMLGAQENTSLILVIDGEDAEQALQELHAFIEDNE